MEVRSSPRRPSLYIFIRLARLVQNFRERLKARVKSRAQREALLRSEQADLEKLQAEAETQTRYVQFKDSRNRKQFSKLVVFPRRRQSPYWLLEKLDRHLASGGTRLTTVASKDELLLDYDAQEAIRYQRIEQASHVLDITTLLLTRLHFTACKGPTGRQAVCDHKAGDAASREKYLANLEHLLRCLQQAALDALIRHSLDALESDYRHWDMYLEQQRRLRTDWFTEWPSGQPPLSTTMPWNIKPSLVVLWGVCWMFYMTNGLPNESGQTHEDAWAVAPQPSWGVGGDVQDYSEAYSTQSSLAPRQPDRTAISHPGHPNRMRSSSGYIHGPVMSSSDMIGSLTVQSFPVEHEMTQSAGHMIVRSPTHLAPTFQAVVQPPRTPRQHERPSSRRNTTHIRTTENIAATSLVTSSSDVPFATPTIWQQNPDQASSFPQSHNDWQPTPDGNIFQGGSQLSYSPSGQLLNQQLTIPRTPSIAYRGGGGYSNFNQNLSTGDLQMPDYPSPGSSASEQTNVTCPVNAMPGSAGSNPLDNTSPKSLYHSPQQESGGQEGQDLPRNNAGQIYCNHLDCAQNPPTFMRKCEWSKHMDKHTRPYICREPGCEKIRGFTYSGGLLRHEREVHRQHGGPKAPRFCPYPNCKRSTGQGFSRKENLMEHLRRVHRGEADVADDDATRSPALGQQPLLSPAGQAGGRKRRRVAEEEEDDDDDEEEEQVVGESVAELRELVRTLRAELVVKDARIRQLQEVINRSSRALQGAGPR